MMEFQHNGREFKIGEDNRTWWLHDAEGTWVPVNRKMPAFDDLVMGLIEYARGLRDERSTPSKN